MDKHVGMFELSEAKQRAALRLVRKNNKFLASCVAKYIEGCDQLGFNDDETACVIVTELIYMAIKVTGVNLKVSGLEVTAQQMDKLVNDVQTVIAREFDNIIADIMKRRAESN